jgi:hypothetical protein
MAISISQPPIAKQLVAVASTSTTATSPAFSIPYADNYTFYLNVTTATGGTCDVGFQTSVDGGTTYVNVPWRFAQIATTTGCLVLNVRAGVGPAGDATAATGTGTLIAANGGALALQAVVDPRYMKITYTIVTGPDAFTLYVIANPRGATIGVD